MRKHMLTAALALAIPAVLAAQTPSIPNDHASDMAKAKVAAAMLRRATHVRGEAVGVEHRPVTPATRAVPATRATPATPAEGGAAIPATRAKPAVPASPSHKPANPGSQGMGRRP